MRAEQSRVEWIRDSRREDLLMRNTKTDLGGAQNHGIPNDLTFASFEMEEDAAETEQEKTQP